MFVHEPSLCVKAAMSGCVSSPGSRSFACALLCKRIYVFLYKCMHLCAILCPRASLPTFDHRASPAQRCHLALARTTTDYPRGAIRASQCLLLTTVPGSAVRWTGANSPDYEQNDKTDLEAVMGLG